MISNRWQRIIELFDQAVELEAGQQDEFLREQCGSDTSLIRMVDGLLSADAEPTGSPGSHPLMGSSLIAGDAQVLAANAVSGDRLGPYRLQDEIGRGGMGVVFRADRDDETFQRQVAIKLLNGRLATAEARRRLNVERQILANLDHPFIARLYDAGSTEGGSPFFVMELVDGLPIDAYCDQQQFSIEDRIDLFLKVCEAVEEAHRNLVVHRDLKPSNILITEDGIPKLLDFGIAKLLDPDSMGVENGKTESWMRVLTPGYASPEQVRGEPITTTADVYSLGILLFKLVSGGLPFEFSGASLEQIDRELQSREAPLASSAFRRVTSEIAADQHTKLRGTTPVGLASSLAGDLDSILAKALRSSVKHRYVTVGRLAADLRRLRSGFPVTARAGGASYRAQKFIRRHRWPLTGLGAVTAALLSFLIGLALLSVRLERERDDKGAVIDFIVDLFESADPSNALGESLTVVDVLDKTDDRLVRLADQPQVESTLREVLGRIHLSLGNAKRAVKLFSENLDIESRLHGEQSQQAALARSRLGLALLDSSDFEGAVEQGRRAVADLRRQSSAAADLVSPLNRWVTSLCIIDDIETASSPSQEALALAEQVSGLQCEGKKVGPSDAHALHCSNLATSLINRGAVLRKLEDLESAIGHYERARSLVDQLLERDHPNRTQVLTVQAEIYRDLGQHEKARTAFLEVLASQQRVLGTDHPVIARTYNLISNLLFEMKLPEEALAAKRQSVNILLRTWGPEHPRTIWSEMRLARQLIEHGYHEEAKSRIQTHLPLWRELDLKGECWVLAQIEGVLGRALASSGEIEEAEQLIVQSFFTVHGELGGHTTAKQARRVDEALARLTAFYEAQNQGELASRYRQGAPGS